MTVLIHPNALCETQELGDGTRIWAFAHVLSGARIGRDCNICDGVFIESDVIVGDRVTVKCGVQLWDGMRVDDDVFIGPNVTFANDKFPRSKVYQPRVLRTSIDRGASIGANSTIMPGLKIGRYAMVGAGSVVTGDVPAFSMVMGNPGRITGYVDSAARITPLSEHGEAHPGGSATGSLVPGVMIHRLSTFSDLRGSLAVAEFPNEIPLIPKRGFLVYEVPTKDVRGERAHRRCAQFMICVSGSMSLVVDDSRRRQDILLDRRDIGVYVPPMVWTVQYKHSKDAVLLVLASDAYDPDDYVRDYEEFVRLKMMVG
jgi:acetyltransferase-like isoleucine patch superfamily enzyme/dTDP-4-dehydrorhamnose 3,5-epimerase-like enzyme